MSKQWNIQTLNIERIKDLANCQDDGERGMADAICKQEILALAKTKAKLSPVDKAILSSLFSHDTLQTNGIVGYCKGCYRTADACAPDDSCNATA